MKLMRGPEIYGLNGITRKSRSSVYRDIRAGTFPQPVKIGPRSVAWKSTDVEAWLASRPTRDGVVA